MSHAESAATHVEARQQVEQRWRTAFENSAIGITMADFAGHFFAANSVFRTMLGYTESELYQLTFLDVTYEEDRKANQELVRDLVEGKRQHFQIEKRYRRKDGTLVWGRNDVALVPGIGGAAPFWFAVVEDITQRKEEESARRYTEEKYRLVVETASDAVISLDETSAILLANPATTRIFGYDPAELIGKPLTMLMPEFLRKLHEVGFKRYLATGQRHINWQGTELVGRRKNGQEFPVEISFGELTKDGHRVFTGFIRDISERKQAEEAESRPKKPSKTRKLSLRACLDSQPWANWRPLLRTKSISLLRPSTTTATRACDCSPIRTSSRTSCAGRCKKSSRMERAPAQSSLASGRSSRRRPRKKTRWTLTKSLERCLS